MDVNIDFSRSLLKGITREVKENFPAIKLRDAWVWNCGRDHWEFHYGDFYWHGRASNAYEARGHGWAGYLKHKKIEGWGS